MLSIVTGIQVSNAVKKFKFKSTKYWLTYCTPIILLNTNIAPCNLCRNIQQICQNNMCNGMRFQNRSLLSPAQSVVVGYTHQLYSCQLTSKIDRLVISIILLK